MGSDSSLLHTPSSHSWGQTRPCFIILRPPIHDPDTTVLSLPLVRCVVAWGPDPVPRVFLRGIDEPLVEAHVDGDVEVVGRRDAPLPEQPAALVMDLEALLHGVGPACHRRSGPRRRRAVPAGWWRQ